LILIVGGAGYIGSHVNKLLTSQGFETVVFDNLSLGHRDFVKWGSFVEGDLSDVSAIRSCFESHKIDAVMHFSAKANVGESISQPSDYYANNVVYTLNLLNIMVEFKVDKFIFSSTCATYGTPQKIPMTELHRQWPINPYGWTKLMVERILVDYEQAYGISHVNLRYFNAAGADPDGEIGERHKPETHLIPLVIHAILGVRKSISIFGTDYDTKDGTCIRDYIHVNDLADAHIKALAFLKAGNKSDSFNLGNGHGFSVRDIIETVKSVSGKTCTVEEVERRVGDPAVLIGTSEKAQKVLNWQPQLADIDTIVETAWNWHQKELG